MHKKTHCIIRAISGALGLRERGGGVWTANHTPCSYVLRFTYWDFESIKLLRAPDGRCICFDYINPGALGQFTYGQWVSGDPLCRMASAL